MEGVGGWASLMRVDMLALFLMYAGLGIYLGMGQRQRWQYVAGVFFVLALFTKETMLSAPLACLTFGLLVLAHPHNFGLGVFAHRYISFM